MAGVDYLLHARSCTWLHDLSGAHGSRNRWETERLYVAAAVIDPVYSFLFARLFCAPCEQGWHRRLPPIRQFSSPAKALGRVELKLYLVRESWQEHRNQSYFEYRCIITSTRQ